MSIIKLEDVSKVYPMGQTKVEAMKSVDLTIIDGESVIIHGPSGSGKSTMMNMIGCLDVPTRGKIFLDGKNISRLGESALASLRGKKIGFIFQTFNLIPNLTALENVALPIELQGTSTLSAQKKAKKHLDDVGLGDRVKHYPTQMSGGERQRVAVARALANDPEVILADEPTGNLDTKTGKKIMSLLGGLNRKHGKTLIIVTHDRALTKYGDRVVHIRDGKIEKVTKR